MLSYYNVPVVSTAGALENPLRTLRAVARADDFVVIKLDCDQPAIEWALIQQILHEPGLAARIDELYWEHHVLKHPMAYTLGGWGVAKARRTMNETIEESFRTFARLRELGIRAHSWV